MARRPKSPSSLVAAAEQVVGRSTDGRELRRAQSMLLPAAMGLSLEQTGRAIGRSRSSVIRMRAEFRRTQEGQAVGSGWGGRRRQNMTREQEKELLSPFFERAGQGGMLVVAPIKAAYEQALGRAVPESTVYRLLARHGWRKIAPRRHHPKRDAAAQERWEKTFRVR